MLWWFLAALANEPPNPPVVLAPLDGAVEPLPSVMVLLLPCSDPDDDRAHGVLTLTGGGLEQPLVFDPIDNSQGILGAFTGLLERGEVEASAVCVDAQGAVSEPVEWHFEVGAFWLEGVFPADGEVVGPWGLGVAGTAHPTGATAELTVEVFAGEELVWHQEQDWVGQTIAVEPSLPAGSYTWRAMARVGSDAVRTETQSFVIPAAETAEPRGCSQGASWPATELGWFARRRTTE